MRQDCCVWIWQVLGLWCDDVTIWDSSSSSFGVPADSSSHLNDNQSGLSSTKILRIFSASENISSFYKIFDWCLSVISAFVYFYRAGFDLKTKSGNVKTCSQQNEQMKGIWYKIKIITNQSFIVFYCVDIQFYQPPEHISVEGWAELDELVSCQLNRFIEKVSVWINHRVELCNSDIHCYD